VNTYEADGDIIVTLTRLIPTDYWYIPDLKTFECYMPSGGTERGLSLRLRNRMGLPPGPARRDAAPDVIIGSPSGLRDIIARANCRVNGGYTYLWRRYAPGTDRLQIERDAAVIIKQVFRMKMSPGTMVAPAHAVEVHSDLTPVTPPALPLPRRASTSISGMPEPEFLRLMQDVQDDAGRRGVTQVAAVAPMTPEAAWDITDATLADMSAERLRRLLANGAAERERRREALQMEYAAALQAQLAALG